MLNAIFAGADQVQVDILIDKEKDAWDTLQIHEGNDKVRLTRPQI